MNPIETLPEETEASRRPRISMGYALVTSLVVDGCTRKELPVVEQNGSQVGYEIGDYMTHITEQGINLTRARFTLQESLPGRLNARVKWLEDMLMDLLITMESMAICPDMGIVCATEEQIQDIKDIHAGIDEMCRVVRAEYDIYH